MRKGAVFTIEAGYALIAVFAIILMIFSFLNMIEQPNYDLITELKVAHDMGEANSSTPPEGYEFGVDCSNNPSAVKIDYYEYAAATNNEVCMKQ